MRLYRFGNMYGTDLRTDSRYRYQQVHWHDDWRYCGLLCSRIYLFARLLRMDKNFSSSARNFDGCIPLQHHKSQVRSFHWVRRYNRHTFTFRLDNKQHFNVRSSENLRHSSWHNGRHDCKQICFPCEKRKLIIFKGRCFG